MTAPWYNKKQKYKLPEVGGKVEFKYVPVKSITILENGEFEVERDVNRIVDSMETLMTTEDVLELLKDDNDPPFDKVKNLLNEVVELLDK